MKMTNHSSESSASKQSETFVSLQKEIERQKRKIIDVDHKNSEKTASISKLTESLNKRYDECEKELLEMRFINSNMNRYMESIKREHEQITKENEQLSDRIVQLEKQLKSKRNLELENQKQLNDRIVQLEKQLKSKQKLESENQKLKGKLDLMKHMEDEFLKMVGTLHMNITEKEQLLKESEDYNQSLINKERESNDELQKARKRMIEGVAERISRFVNIGVKRMGLVDPRPFLKAMRAKKTYDKEEATQKALEMCSKWEKYVEDPHWYPFKIITVNGRSQEIIDDEDEKLKRVKREVGMGACRAVVVALKEMNEYNASGRFVISELWNYREGKRASLEEGVEFLLGKWKTKKQKIHQMVTQHQEQDPPTSTTTKC